MSRYIDEDKIRYTDLSDGLGLCYVAFKDIIDRMPTADVVEMPVRCRDCIYCEQRTCSVTSTGVLCLCNYFEKSVGEYGDGFCSWGVKYSQSEGKEVRNDDK